MKELDQIYARMMKVFPPKFASWRPGEGNTNRYPQAEAIVRGTKGICYGLRTSAAQSWALQCFRFVHSAIATFLVNDLVKKLAVPNDSRVRLELHREATVQMYLGSPTQYNNFFCDFAVNDIEGFQRQLNDMQTDLDMLVSYVDWFPGLLWWSNRWHEMRQSNLLTQINRSIL